MLDRFRLRAAGWLLGKSWGLSIMETLPMKGYAGGGFRFGPDESAPQLLQAYRKSPWPNRKLARLCGGVAGLSIEVGVDDARGEFHALPQHPLSRLIAHPNPILRPWDFTFLTELYFRATGEAFWRLSRGGLQGTRGRGVPQALWVLPEHWVEVRRDRQANRVLGYKVRTAYGGSEELPPEDMLWLHNPDPLDPYVEGVGELLSSVTEVQTFEYASESNKHLMLNDSTPRGYLSMPGSVGPEDAKRLKDDWKSKQAGFWNEGDVPLFFGGAKFEPTRIPPKDMQYVEGQKWLRDVILAGIPPETVGVVENSNRATAEAGEYMMAKMELQPAGERWEDWWGWLAREFDRRLVVRVANPVPEDRDFTIKVANEGLARSGLTRGEWRENARRLGLEVGELPDEKARVFLMPLTTIEVPADAVEPKGAEKGSTRPKADAPSADARTSPAASTTIAKQPPGIDPSNLRDVVGEAREEADLLMERLAAAYVVTMEARWAVAAAQVSLAATFDVTHPEVARFLRQEAGTRIVGITETTLERVRMALAEGVEAGEGVSLLARRIGAVFEEARGARALTIARTETLTASNRAAYIAYGESGVVPKLEWLLAPDYDPAEDNAECEPYDGLVVEYGQDFSPGVLFPPLHPNCRCTIAPVLENGGRGYSDRQAHITAIGVQHTRVERVFLNALRRGLQDQQNRTLRRLRAAARNVA